MSELLQVVVDGMWREGDTSLAVRLVSSRGEPLPAWRPGAHIDLHLPDGTQRQYSLTGPTTGAEGYLICVARDRKSRGGSRYIHEALRPGQTLRISPPRNLFMLQPAERVVLLAAGIGITPLYAMLLQLEADGVPCELHYYVKRRENAAFVRQLAQRFSQGSCALYCSEEGQSPRQHLATTLAGARAGELLYLCGPQGFMACAREVAVQKGWQEAQIHSEAFQATAPVADARGEADTFTVTLASSGAQWPVPAHQTIAQVLQQQGVAIPLSCEMGMCGACLTPVIEGVVDHRDTVQSPAEKAAAEQRIALCCSRSRSPNLLIDL
ncbi:PDR/VanB family oxidoreductase [Raoultella terrigena]